MNLTGGTILAHTRRTYSIPTVHYILVTCVAAYWNGYQRAYGGSGMAAIILGSPYAGLLLLTLVLVVQAFVFYDGGITRLRANIFNMGLVSCWSGYYTYRWLEGRVGLFLSAIVFILAVAAPYLHPQIRTDWSKL